ncbi:MAG: hypothetical protein M1358_20955 [Chloroflexi bacterium]|nr:hypothetical protein [Chloroflexota bacterium]
MSIFLEDSAARQYILRDKQTRGPGSHVFRFNGTVEADGKDGLDRRVLASGTYTYTLQAIDGSQKIAEEKGKIDIVDADTTPPRITHLAAFPETISPNYDAIDDISQITYGLTKKASVEVFITDSGNSRYSLQSGEQKDPGEYEITFAGKDSTQRLLPNGVYTYTVQATDDAGNRTSDRGTVKVVDSGNPQAAITSIDFTPTRLMNGETLKITVKVKNIGPVTLRTQGPDPGYTYTTNDIFSSVSNGEYSDKAGLWRVGVDWEGNSGGARRFPFRWGFGKDLAPGQEVTVVGYLKMLEKEREMWFYAGLVQEKISYPTDRLGRTLIRVGF